MARNNSWGTMRSPRINVWRIVRIGLAVLALVGAIALGWYLIRSHSAHASNLIQAATTTYPWGIALDTNGHIWVAEPACEASPTCGTPPPGMIGEYNMSDDSKVQDFSPIQNYNPVFVAADANGNIWFTDPTHDAIGELIPGTFIWAEWTAPTIGAAPYDLLLDKNGNLWFTEIDASQIGFFNTSSHTFVETATPTANSHPYGITMDPHGTIWFAENTLAKIGSFTPTKSGSPITITEHTISTPLPHLITSDKSGNIWYSEGFAGQVGEYIPAQNKSRDFSVARNICPTPTGTPTRKLAPCPGTHISGIATDSNGLVWFDDSLSARIGFLNPATGAVRTITIGPSSHPHDGLAVDSNNNIWVTEQYGFRLDELTGPQPLSR